MRVDALSAILIHHDRMDTQAVMAELDHALKVLRDAGFNATASETRAYEVASQEK